MNLDTAGNFFSKQQGMKTFGKSDFLFDSDSGFSGDGQDEDLPIELQFFSSGWEKSIADSPGWRDSTNSVVLLKNSIREPLHQNSVMALRSDRKKQPNGDLPEELLD
jgi:hypothetical protein